MELLFKVTGFKSRCVSFCYLVFSAIVIVSLVIYAIGTFTGIVVQGDILVDIVKISATFFGIAITAVFGASYVEERFKPSEKTPQQV